MHAPILSFFRCLLSQCSAPVALFAKKEPTGDSPVQDSQVQVVSTSVVVVVVVVRLQAQNESIGRREWSREVSFDDK